MLSANQAAWFLNQLFLQNKSMKQRHFLDSDTNSEKLKLSFGQIKRITHVSFLYFTLNKKSTWHGVIYMWTAIQEFKLFWNSKKASGMFKKDILPW